MAAVKVKQFWTAFISLLFALLASVGLASTATAAQQTATQQPKEPAADATGVRTASVPAQPVYRGLGARSRSLPPTIRQRISAEAHGSSPSVRHMSAAAPLETDLYDLALAAA